MIDSKSGCKENDERGDLAKQPVRGGSDCAGEDKPNELKPHVSSERGEKRL
jgi:hypothetical protein